MRGSRIFSQGGGGVQISRRGLSSEGLSEPEFYGDLVYKFKKLIGSNEFSACLVFNPITVDNYAAFFNCTPVGRASDSMMAPT